MTITQAKNIAINWFKNQLGYHEGINNYNKYAENEDLKKLYGWKPQNQPWCDIFVDTGFIECFGLQNASKMTYQIIGSGSALCRTSASYYKNNNAWYKTPSVGDQAFFYVSGEINHTGFVTEVKNGAFTCIEGNASNKVMERTYAVSDLSVAGFGRPKWSVLTTAQNGELIVDEPKQPITKKTTYDKYVYKVPLNLLRKGNYGPLVKTVQILLNKKGFKCTINSSFDTETENAVKEFQRKKKLSVDGEVGIQVYSKLFKT